MAKPYANGSGSSAAIMGHPLHPMVVPLPIGALILAFVSDLLHIGTGQAVYIAISEFLLAAGLLTGVLAAALGMVEMMGRSRARTMGLAWAHGGMNFLVLVLAMLTYMLRPAGEVADGTLATFHVVITGTVALLLLVSGWLGGELSYKHGVGVAETVGADHPNMDPDLDAYGRPDIGKA